MRPPGKGQEGSADLHVDVTTGELVIVKTYASDGRNEIPSHLVARFEQFTSRWPAKIEAGLLLTDLTTRNQLAYFQVKDYFILESGNIHWSRGRDDPVHRSRQPSRPCESHQVP